MITKFKAKSADETHSQSAIYKPKKKLNHATHNTQQVTQGLQAHSDKNKAPGLDIVQGIGHKQKTRHRQQAPKLELDQPTNVHRNFGQKPNNPKNPQPQAQFNKGNLGRLKIMCLGGLEEVGRNMTVFEYEHEIVIVDMGLQFPEEDMYGIDYIIPNIEYLRDKADWIKGVIITHGHYDHIGGIAHIMGEIGNPPMFMGRLTAGLVQKKARENRKCPELNISELNETMKLQLGKNFRLEFLRMNHSIPDCFAPIIHTPVGTVMHTGDFKIDYTPVNDKPADLQRIAQIGAAGVTLLMSDSTDAVSPGHQLSESAIGNEMLELFQKLDGRIIIGTFASQISRIQKLFEIAEKLGRRIYLQGRSIQDNVEIAHQIGYLKFNPRTLIQTDGEFKRLPDDKIIIIGTGAQGESNAFLMKVASDEHRLIKLKATDTVIFSSSIIPGNERSIVTLRDLLVRQNVRVVNYKMLDVHAGGHAKQEDLKLVLRLIKPKFFMPIQANYYMLKAHADLGVEVGISPENIFIADNGQILEITKSSGEQKMRITNEKVPTEYVMVDGLGVGDVSHIVLRDRRAMAEDGMIVIISTIDSKTGDLIGSPDIISRGFVYMKEHKELIQKVRDKIKSIVKERPNSAVTDDDYIKNKVRNDIGQFLFTQTKRRPMVLPVVIKV